MPWQKKTDARRGFGALPTFAPYRQRLASVWGLLGPSPPPLQGAEPASFRWIRLPGAPPLLPAPDLVAASLVPAAADQIQRQEHTARQLPLPDAVLSPPSTECYGVQGSSLMVPPWASIEGHHRCRHGGVCACGGRGSSVGCGECRDDGWRPQWRVRRGGGHRQDPSHIQRLPRPHPAYIVAVPVPYIQRLVSGKFPGECELLLTAVRQSSQGEQCNSAQNELASNMRTALDYLQL